MSQSQLIPRQAAIAIADMLDNCALLRPEQKVLILAHVDGLHGGDNLVEEQVINWIKAGIDSRDAYSSILWVDEPFRAYEWRMPSVLKAAMAGIDVLINNSFDITFEEVREFRQAVAEHNVLMVRNFATTAALMSSAYALTPHELVCEIRFHVGSMFKQGATWSMSDANGTRLQGRVGTPLPYMPWTQWRRDTNYRPFPEWVHPPVAIEDTEGELVFDRTLSWWSRYVGLPPFFKHPVRVRVEQGMIKEFEGQEEAETLREFFRQLTGRFGKDVAKLSMVHTGVHPNAWAREDQVPLAAYRRLIEHQHTCNIHFHLGNIMDNPDWPANMLHLTADVRQATWTVDGQVVHQDGYLTALDRPEVQAIAARYPDRPGVPAKSGQYGFAEGVRLPPGTSR